MGAAAISDAAMGRLARLMEGLSVLPEELRTMFISTIVRGDSKATVCAANRIDGHTFDRNFKQMLREIQRAPASVRDKPAQPIKRLRFPVPPNSPTGQERLP